MIPVLLWHQSPKHIHISIEIKNANKEKIAFENNNLVFSASSNNKDYELNVELFGKIIPNETAYVVNDNNIKLILTKQEQTSWSSLQKDKNLFKNNIKTNWDLWDDSDDEEELANIYNNNNFGSNQFNMEEMMKMFQSQQNNSEENDESNCCQESNFCSNESKCCSSEECPCSEIDSEECKTCCGNIQG